MKFEPGTCCRDQIQKQVQFLHPDTLDKAISTAAEYCALQGWIDKTSKPDNSESRQFCRHYCKKIKLRPLDKKSENRL